ILFIVLSTGTLSFVQERNAGKVVEKLQSLIALKSTVIRDGKEIALASSEIVPGDILLLKAGNMVPADCLLIESNELNSNESSLTGESFPVRKEAGVLDANTELSKRSNTLWEGTNVISGTGKALVIAIGENTIFGSITKSAAVSVETTFEKGIKDFGFFLMKITLVLSVFILVVNLWMHKGVIDSALFALALAVGMAPELLPAITTIAMSAGAKRMLEKKVIVKKLNSIQNLGEVNLLCTDKTGTITEGAINVSGIVDPMGNENDFVKTLAIWNATFESGYANPIDEAIKKLPLTTKETVTKTGEIPYDFIRKRLSVAIDRGKEQLLISKGAFDNILSICESVRMSDGTIVTMGELKAGFQKQYEDFGSKGNRVIGICYKPLTNTIITKNDEVKMIFAGFILLQDPVKEGIPEVIKSLNDLSVSLKIITGDNENVARTIAIRIGIAEPVILSGQELLHINQEALEQRAKDTHVFAGVEPQQKERIIQALRKNFTVAYIGDGINDVSAINAADVGISVENAVDVAKEAADFVLMEKNLMVVVEGIKEGRITFANTLKYIFINTGSTFGNMFSVAAASLLLPYLPMLPKQILLTNFITDFPYLSVASDNVDDERIKKPGKWDLKFIRNYMVFFGIHSSLFDIITFISLLFFLHVQESAFQTGWFIESVLSELFILFIIRTRKNFFKSRPGKYLLILSFLGLILTLGLPYSPFGASVGLLPLPMINLGVMLTIVALYIFTADLLKVWFFKKYEAG
ncbi:MAG: magnesium-translocating P-type ATPase, partial [Bacteroidia bacterium]|nr:magnesium-translocating P-type ATPase [Bacteroidia bacterium]